MPGRIRYLRNVRRAFPDLDPEEGALAASDLSRLKRRGGDCLDPPHRQFPRWSKLPPRPMSLTASGSICMTLPVTSTAFGTEAKTCHNYDLFTKVTES